jgi:hypothetical protein
MGWHSVRSWPGACDRLAPAAPPARLDGSDRPAEFVDQVGVVLVDGRRKLLLCRSHMGRCRAARSASTAGL